jgi:hypothetical protein
MFDFRAFFQPLDEHRLRKRLWKTGGLLVVFVATFIVVNLFLPAKKAVTRRDLGLDFLAFYYGGTCARTGHFENIYNLEATKQFDREISRREQLNLDNGFGPFWNPPFAAWMFAPLSALPYHMALLCWWGIGFACLGVSLAILCTMIGGGWRTWGLIPLLVMTSMPFFQAFSHGQNSFVSLLLLTITVALWRAEKSLAAGLVCGLLFYKPQLGAVVAMILCISLGWRALLGIGITLAALLLVTVLTMPGTLHTFLFVMPANLRLMQESHSDYIWERHVTLRTFWRILVQGWSKGPDHPATFIGWGICELTLLAGLGLVVLRSLRRELWQQRTDRLIAATVVTMPLLMPFYFDYDLLLLSVAAVLYVADRQRDGAPLPAARWEDRWILRAWIALFFVLEIATMISQHTRVQPVAPIVAALAVLLIRRALREPTNAAEASKPLPRTSVALAA